MKRNFVLLDLLIYVALPLFVWNIMRDYIGDYYAMLLSSVPGIIGLSFYRNEVSKYFWLVHFSHIDCRYFD
ncbi:MAG: hypothetical protein ACQEWF_16795 [Bacillota bacterium]